MKYLSFVLAAAFAATASAHDEGHGPRLSDAGKMGGVIAAVIEAKNAGLGPKARLIYKAELVRLEDGTVRIYLYDKDMRPLKLDKFAKTAKALIETHKNKKISTLPFSLKLEGNAFIGKAPKPPKKPFNIDAVFQEEKLKLLAAFDNLD